MSTFRGELQDNSTLIVWYDYGAGTYPKCDYTPFHTYQPGSSGSRGDFLASATAGPAVLHATFTGALAKLGTVTLTWNGVSWAGLSSDGAAVLSFLGHGTAFQLLSVGPGTAFIVAAQPKSCQPFTWAADDTAQGALAGRFGVSITE